MEKIIALVKKYIGDPKGDYTYIGELEKGKHFVSYMFTDDCMDGKIALCVGTKQYLVVEGGKCRQVDNKEYNAVLKYVAAHREYEDD